jgi:hypothetical protein
MIDGWGIDERWELTGARDGSEAEIGNIRAGDIASNSGLH